MQRKPAYDKVLFIILMALLFMPMLQGRFRLIPLKPLNGVILATEQPKFSLTNYRSSDYARQKEAYVSENFGFREPIIRLYNQYLWNCYRKTYAHDVVAGKQGWLYTPESVRDYYGTEMLRWQPSPEAARQCYDREIKYMTRARSILKENGVELLAFIAPEKSFLYPEYLPERERDTTTFNACAYFLDKFEASGFPCIDMNGWFQQMKDTVTYPLIPQTGAHWVFPAVYATDSLTRYMGKLKGIELPKLKIGALHESENHGVDNDLEQLLNLSLPIWHRFGFSPTAEVTVQCDSACVKPKVLFIGNSFFWAMKNQIPMKEMFENVEFWYYFSTAYSGDSLTETTPVVDFNMLEKLLDFDYIVWFTTGNQLNKGTNGFASSVILTLSIEDSIRLAYINRIADTLSLATADSTRQREAISILYNHPELIPELCADSLTTQNSKIPYAKYTKDIRKDSAWMAALEAQAFLRTATMQQMLHVEVDRIKAGKPLYRDADAEIRFARRCQQEVTTLKERMRNNEETMGEVRKKAEKYSKTLEKALNDDAVWLIRQKYGLDRRRLIDDPDAQIMLPTSIKPAP